MRPQALSTVLRSTLRPSITSSSSSTLTLSRARLPGSNAAKTASPVGTTSTTFTRSSSSSHDQESFESFSARYVAFFQSAEDLFEVQRGLNNCFAHDLVPSPAVVEAALRAARRVNDYSTAVRVFEGIREKVENKQQYLAYLEELKGVREELGVFFFTFFYFCALRLMKYVRRSGHKGRAFHLINRSGSLGFKVRLRSKGFDCSLITDRIFQEMERFRIYRYMHGANSVVLTLFQKTFFSRPRAS
jgi:cytochrome c oxidase subunit 5a